MVFLLEVLGMFKKLDGNCPASPCARKTGTVKANEKGDHY